MTDIFIIGSKGIPARYGGFETFVDKLTLNNNCKTIKYHVACLSDNPGEFEYNNARCFNVKVKNVGSATAVLYDIKALKMSIDYIDKNNIKKPIIYILACRIGPFLSFYRKILKKKNVKLFVNPDGNEWKRSKWNKAIKMYWKLSERLMIKNSDLIVCDSKGIEEYIKREYDFYKPKTTFIAYGAEINKSNLITYNETVAKWYESFNIKEKNYYLIVGRFVPENNYETIIKEFMTTDTNKDLIIITNIQKNAFYNKLLRETNFHRDKRIKFVGTVYDNNLLSEIRKNAYGYIHGHEVGGTNPSLLEALANTNINILLDVNFNKEVALECAHYFNKSVGNLASIINKIENFNDDNIYKLGVLCKKRIIEEYSWGKIVKQYEDIFNANQ